ncbi:cystatin isoform X1 [Kryptolebias marmoratus]|uniref:Cystatin-like n=1 Tax=Kryptolebias marmoratus TaxID=37003 RepID=A0A3Q3B6J3_KRYMA|nr:cystatin isoform X1 [Kryptolebias marmoratus]
MWKTVFPIFAALLAVGLGTLVGGRKDIDVDDEILQDALNLAVVDYNKLSNNLFYFKNMEVVKAQLQVVEGVLYFITVKMGKTTCIKTSSLEHCPFQTDSETFYICEFEAWSRPWLKDNPLMITIKSCQ